MTPEYHEKPSPPPQDSKSNFTPTHGGVGSLPGSEDDAGVSILPEKRKNEKNKPRYATSVQDTGIHVVISVPPTSLISLLQDHINPSITHPSSLLHLPPPHLLQWKLLNPVPIPQTLLTYPKTHISLPASAQMLIPPLRYPPPILRRSTPSKALTSQK